MLDCLILFTLLRHDVVGVNKVDKIRQKLVQCMHEEDIETAERIAFERRQTEYEWLANE